MTDTISASEIIERAAARGYGITQTQLARWHRAGLLPKPVRVHPGRGSVSKYPGGAQFLAIEIADLLQRKPKRNLDWVGWQLWMFAMEVPERYWRPHLRRAFNQNRDAANKFLALLDTDDDERQAEIIKAFLRADDIPDSVRRMRKTVGEKDFGLFLVFMSNVLEGDPTGVSVHRGTKAGDHLAEVRMLDRAMGFVRARMDYAEGGSPWLTGDSSDIFRDLAPALAKIRDQDFFESLTQTDLLEARDELYYLRNIIVSIQEAVAKAPNDKNAFGLKFAARLLLDRDRDWEAGLLATWLIARTHQTLRENARSWIKAQLQLFEASKSQGAQEPRKLLQTRQNYPFKEPRKD
ncbi:MAG: hypothetical protein RLO80_07370 [Hyphomonas sp.]